MMSFDVFVQYWVTEAKPDGPNRSETVNARKSEDPHDQSRHVTARSARAPRAVTPEGVMI